MGIGGKKDGMAMYEVERSLYNINNEQIDILEIIKLHVDIGLGVAPTLHLKSIREYPIDEIERHEDLIISCYRAGDLKLVQIKLRVHVHMDGGVKVVTITDLPYFSPNASDLGNQEADSDRIRRAQIRARRNAVDNAIAEMTKLISQCQIQALDAKHELLKLKDKSAVRDKSYIILNVQ